MQYYEQTKDVVLEDLKTRVTGLSSDEANQRLKEYGKNALCEEKKKSVLAIFLSQFKDVMVLILIIASILSIVTGNVESAVVILVVIVLNSILGTVQYVKAEKSLDSLKALQMPTAKAFRDGQIKEIPSTDIVPGDVLMLEAGDLVVADGRILNNYSLMINESTLTGESTNVEKTEEALGENIPLAERTNMVYSSSLVAYGRANYVVTGTGMNTEMGKIAGLMNNVKNKQTPLQISLDNFSKKLAIVIVVISAIVLILSYIRGMTVIDSLLFAVALAVAAVPEALGSIVTIVQAMGTKKMASQQAIIRELKACETLGCVSVICSDKTGTLTQNKMSVKRLYVNDLDLPLDEALDKVESDDLLILNAVLNNDSSLNDGKGIGDPTEFCLLEMADIIGVDYEKLRKDNLRLGELPFDSDRKLMSSIYNIKGKDLVFTKGAVDVILNRTAGIYKSSQVCDFTKQDAIRIEEINRRYSENGMRVLAFAYREGSSIDVESETDFIFLGLIAMIDPPRVESALAVSQAKSAGIKTVMITGDHLITATAIAKEIGIYCDGDEAITGSTVDSMSDEELMSRVENISVYARVSPENKIRIVDAWQKKDAIVAMTGDGVNDAPALKKADIGVAMGITGTEVSKDAAAMVLADDNFATIIKAVANGRNVYKNIMNAILFLLSGNTAAILAVLYTSIIGLPIPFQAVQLLFINLVTDSLPALAIGVEPADKDILKKKPRSKNEALLNKRFVTKLIYQGLLIAAVTLTAYHIGLSTDAATASTMAFATLTMARLFHGFNQRGDLSIFRLGILKNISSIGAFVLGTILLLLILCVPALEKIFMVSTLSCSNFIYILLLAFIPTFIIQTIRVIYEMLHKSK